MSSRQTVIGAFVAWLVCGALLLSAAPQTTRLDTMLAAYAAGDDHVFARELRDNESCRTLVKEFDLATGPNGKWTQRRRPVQLVFMLDLAAYSLDHHWTSWYNILKTSREFLESRSAAPGKNAAEDEFEIAWHKAAVALMEGQRCAACLEDVLFVTISAQDKPPPQGLVHRMTPAASGSPTLIDPWIVLTMAILEEDETLTEDAPADALGRLGAAAMRDFDRAMAYPSTRTEALVRKAWTLIRLARPKEALDVLDAIGPGDDHPDDPAMRYWRVLFRARALDDAGHPDEAARGYHDALALAPGAQSPTLALSVLALRQNRDDEAMTLAAEVRAGNNAIDPWWSYATADFRFFNARMTALREYARR